MSIELKGNNYYSRVFKRVNYKLQNSTFWVVITIWDWGEFFGIHKQIQNTRSMGSCTFHPNVATIPIWLLPLYIRMPPPFASGCYHFPPGCRPFSTRMYHIRKSAAAAIPSGCLTSGIQEPDGRGGSFNFSGQTYPDPPIVLTRRISQQFCTVPRCFPEASRYLRLTSLDIYI